MDWIKIHFRQKFRNHQRLTKFLDYCYCLTTIDRVIRQQVHSFSRVPLCLLLNFREISNSRDELRFRDARRDEEYFFAYVVVFSIFFFFSKGKKKRVLDALPNVARIQVIYIYIYIYISCRTREPIFFSTSTRLSV